MAGMADPGRRTPRGRRGRSLILTGLGFLLIGVLFTASSFVLGGGRYHGYRTISWWPVIIGLLTMARGAFQAVADRRARASGQGQELPPGDRPAPSGDQGRPEPAGDHPAYDQPGYGMPRNPGATGPRGRRPPA